MIHDFFERHFDRFNIENRKTRVYLPSLFIGYLLFIFCLTTLLKYLFPMEEPLITSDNIEKKLNLLSYTIFFIFGAIMEEFKYRALLTVFNLKWVLISLSTLITSVLMLRIKVYYLYPESILPLLGYILNFIMLVVVIYLILHKILFKYHDRIGVFITSNFYLVLWFQVFLFAIWHILFSGQTNYTHPISLFIFHSSGALFYTYIRINYGILYSIILHFLYNFCVKILPTLFIYLITG